MESSAVEMSDGYQADSTNDPEIPRQVGGQEVEMEAAELQELKVRSAAASHPANGEAHRAQPLHEDHPDDAVNSESGKPFEFE